MLVPGKNLADHFRGTTKMIEIGKGGQRPIDSFRLSREACYAKAKQAMLIPGKDLNDHFMPHFMPSPNLGQNGQRSVDSFRLSREACYAMATLLQSESTSNHMIGNRQIRLFRPDFIDRAFNAWIPTGATKIESPIGPPDDQRQIYTGEYRSLPAIDRPAWH